MDVQLLDRVIFGADEHVAKWVAERIPHMYGGDFGKCAALGILDRHKQNMIAGAVFHDYQPEAGTIQMSMAADNHMWATRDVLRDLLAYPFLQLGVFKVWTSTPQDNMMALRINERAGFKREAVLAHHYGKKRHAVICRLTKPQFTRLYEVRHG